MKCFNGSDFRIMLKSASNNLQNNREMINDMNVFPVPDGDTGTNMSLTFGAAAGAVLETDISEVGALADNLARLALRNARGNSGVILSQILRGAASGLAECPQACVSDVKNAFASARDTAYRAVMKPTEGTILTVIREMAEFAEENFKRYDDVAVFLNNILDAGKQSLEHTPEILPELKQAGVVDAGGMGIIVLLEGAVVALAQSSAISLTMEAASRKIAATEQSERTEGAPVNIKYQYCTEFLINKDPERQAAQFTAAIKSKGDCMLVIDDEEIVKVHIHTNHPGYVIEQALKLGELTNLKIDNMKYQHEERIVTTETKEEETVSVLDNPKKYGFVSVSSGKGMSELFSSVNVDVILEGGQTMNPSTQNLIDAVSKVNAETVFILPNNKNIILAAEQVDALVEQRVIVIPTRNIPQGIAAVLAFREEEETKNNVLVMTEMAEAVQCGQVTFAARATKMDGFDIHTGDVIGVVESDVEIVGTEMFEVCVGLTQKLVHEDSGMISIYYGDGTGQEEAEKLKSELEKRFSDLDISLCFGGQPVYTYIIAVE